MCSSDLFTPLAHKKTRHTGMNVSSSFPCSTSCVLSCLPTCCCLAKCAFAAYSCEGGRLGSLCCRLSSLWFASLCVWLYVCCVPMVCEYMCVQMCVYVCMAYYTCVQVCMCTCFEPVKGDITRTRLPMPHDPPELCTESI